MWLGKRLLNDFGLGVDGFGEIFRDSFKSLDLAGKNTRFLLFDSASFREVSHNFKEIQESSLFFLKGADVGCLNQNVSYKSNCVGY